jgi:CRISPR/Cas system CSM-associated protein Csm3 (group 7 of RAMP superfamily)
VGIERRTGAAARHAAAKYDVEVLPPGTEFELRLELRDGDPVARVEGERLLAAVLAEWVAGRAHLGGNVARGLGAFDLVDLVCIEIDLDQTERLMAFLGADDPWTTAKPVEGWLQTTLDDATSLITSMKDMREQAQARWNLRETQAAKLPIHHGWVGWSFVLQATGPFLTHDPTVAETAGFDHAPLLGALGDWTHPVLPGSSLRGVVRSHAERIARTLATHQAIKNDDPVDHFQNHCPACDPLAQRRAAALPLESCDSLLRNEKRIDENAEIKPERLCLACQLFGSTRHGSRLIVEDAAFDGSRGQPVYKMMDFLAVDRFTGGGADRLKFDALALWRPAFRARLHLVSPEPWELGWLTLVLRDLASGWLRVGFGASKGFGEMEIPYGTVTRAQLDAGASAVGQSSIFVTNAWTLDDPALLEQQREWVKAFHQKLADHASYRTSLRLPEDTYFGQVDHIYLAEV